MDVKLIFLHGDLQEEICMKQAHGFAQEVTPMFYVTSINPCTDSSNLLKLGMKKWIKLFFTNFSRCYFDPNIFTKQVGDDIIILVHYVNNLILTSSNTKLLNHVKSNLTNEFGMTILGPLHYFLGLNFAKKKQHLAFPT